MSKIWRTLGGYFFWTYDRGSFHYDVMVTLILVFIFLTPRWMNFKDKPVERTPHPTGVVVSPDGQDGFIYQVEASAVAAGDDDAVRESLMRIIEPIAGEVDLTKVEPVRDRRGNITAYKAWVRRY